MTSVIQHKRSSTTGNVPPSLAAGEVAINETDSKLFYRNPSGTVTPFDLLNYRNGANLIINGGMTVDQENVGIAKTGMGTGTSAYVLDMWKLAITGAGVFSSQQIVDAPAGLYNSLKISVTTADTSIAAGDSYRFYAMIEGHRVAGLGFGTAGAQSVAVGFFVKANRTGTYSGALRNAAANRSYPFSFTVNSSATWEYKTVVIPGDTTGTWPVGNALGMSLSFAMAMGSTFTGTANIWAAADYRGVTGTINGVAATSDYMEITGVTLIPGTTPVPASMAPMFIPLFGESLSLCKRYYEKSYDYDTAPGTATQTGSLCRMSYDGFTLYDGTLKYSVSKLSGPAITIYGINTANTSGKFSEHDLGDTFVADRNATSDNVGETECKIGSDGSFNGGVTGVALQYSQWVADARL